MGDYQEGQVLYKQKRYKEALVLFNSAIEKSRTKNEYHYLAYGRALRKMDRPKEALEVIFPLIEDKIFELDLFVDLIAWCIYDYYVKEYSEKSKYDIFEESKFILENCKQLEINKCIINPIVLTIFKLVKVIKKTSSPNYKKIAYLLEMLDPDKLPFDDEYPFTDEKGKARESASKREFFYQNLSKAYEKTRKYAECIELCDKALSEDIKWHYKNNLWFLARKSYCKCKISNDFEKDVKEYSDVAEKNKFWYMYHKLSNLHLSNNNIPKALYYACLAFDINQNAEKKVNVMMDLGDLFAAKNCEINAEKFYQCCFFYRSQQGWRVSKELEFQVKYYNLSNKKTPNLDDLKRITLMEIDKANLIKTGKILSIDGKKGYGFIEPTIGIENIYFKNSNIKNKNKFLKKSTYVRYDTYRNNGRIVAKNIETV